MNFEYPSQITTNIQIAIVAIRLAFKLTSWNITYLKWLIGRAKQEKLYIIDIGLISYLVIKIANFILRRP